MGLLVDSVTSAVALDRETIEPPPVTMNRAAADLLVGVGRADEEMFIILDAGALLTVMENAA